MVKARRHLPAVTSGIWSIYRQTRESTLSLVQWTSSHSVRQRRFLRACSSPRKTFAKIPVIHSSAPLQVSSPTHNKTRESRLRRCFGVHRLSVPDASSGKPAERARGVIRATSFHCLRDGVHQPGWRVTGTSWKKGDQTTAVTLVSPAPPPQA